MKSRAVTALLLYEMRAANREMWQKSHIESGDVQKPNIESGDVQKSNIFPEG